MLSLGGQVVVLEWVAMKTDADDAAFATGVINSVFDVWVRPELERRGLALDREAIRTVLVEIDPDKKYPRVLLNDEAPLTAEVGVTRDLACGEGVSEDDLDAVRGIRPTTIGPDSGYVCFARLKGIEYVDFDYRYNRGKVSGLLSRAREF
jgi:hypothetical protein